MLAYGVSFLVISILGWVTWRSWKGIREDIETWGNHK